MLSFEWPWLFALIPLPWLIFRFAPSVTQEQSALRVPFFNRLSLPEQTSSSNLYTPKRLKLLLLSLVWLGTVAAATNPTWTGDAINLPSKGRDLLLAVDISGSMEVRDMQWQGQDYDRLSIVKAVVGDFVSRRTTDRLGLVLFGSQAYLQAPLTFDRNTIKRLLNEAQLGFAGGKTAIGDAIGVSIKRLLERPQDSRVIILLTDGANNSGVMDPLKGAELARENNVKIYTVGIGADEMQTAGIFGSRLGARTTNPSVDLDETVLTQIAQQTGGQYFRARSPSDLMAIYQQLDALEPVDQEAEIFRPTQALFFWPLGLGLIASALLFLSSLLSHRVLRSPSETHRESEAPQ